ncbi:MAG: hypothetical protein GY945_10500 [Rhodobacteraceae bacterium]|nr:hypothetical protein [Paracoccaceae bacterium]
MKPTDADLIEKLNALPEQDRADFLEFLGGNQVKGQEGTQLLDLLEASLSLHNNSGKPLKN